MNHGVENVFKKDVTEWKEDILIDIHNPQTYHAL